MKDVTIVSALFNIERENMDGRKWDEYLEWFDITLKLQCPMYLFVTEDVREFVDCLLYTSPSPRDLSTSRMPSSA